MSDTLVDEVPETLRDEPALAGRPAGRPPKRSSALRVAVVALLSLATVVAASALAFYFFMWRYEAVTRRHIPGNANVVARLEIADVLLFGPVRDHLWPLVTRPDPSAPSGSARIARIRAATGVNLATDVREVLVASADATSWVALLGGPIATGGVVKGLATVAKEDRWPGTWRLEGELLVGPGGVAIGQADDGTVAIGTDAAIVTAALPASDDFTRLKLPERGAVTFAVTKQAWEGAAAAAVVKQATVLGDIERATGQLTLGKTPELRMDLEPVSSAQATELARSLDLLIASLRLLTMLVPDLAGEQGALAAARVTVEAGKVVVIAPWSYDALDRAAVRAAALLGAAPPTR